ncbi:MAG: NAD(P)H-dependent oxidoreductase subunit E [Betaproteobacteria bacterium]|nr:NAD(P)H-dependent oxidoreductase subunit E [Betaproteobacteria bacterium]
MCPAIPLPPDPAEAAATAMARHRHDPHELLQVLREVQEACGWIAPEAIDCIQARLALPRAKILGVATFYGFLHVKPCGRYRILFSDNITDRMLGSARLLDRMCRSLWAERGKVSEDGLVSVDTTSCTGLCDQGPAILVNGLAIPRLTEARVDAICDLVRASVPLADWPADYFAVDDNIHRRDLLLGATWRPGAALEAALARGRDGLVGEMKASRLRGRGGAGFPAGLKWEACRDAPGRTRYIVCNADEGEPGNFKDRVLLSTAPDAVVEGMTIGAFATGARRGFLYLRGEYRFLLDRLEAVLARRRAAGLLGESILGREGFDFDVAVHVGAGAYVCGEESALIESLEGKRGTPRNRPPFPVTQGYLGEPTVVNNVETFASSCLVALEGGARYAAVGTAESSGTKLLCVSGDCARPGIYEYPFGVEVRQVLEDCGARRTQAVQVSGPSGACIPAAEFGRRIGFEDLPTAGALMVFDESRDMFEVARNFVHFFAHESCGFCTPCRVGTSLLKNMMDKLANGHGSPYDFAEIERMNGLLQSMSHCGLGHSACNPVLTTIARFRPAYARRLAHGEFEPAFDLDRALSAARQMTGRDDPAAHVLPEPETAE